MSPDPTPVPLDEIEASGGGRTSPGRTSPGRTSPPMPDCFCPTSHKHNTGGGGCPCCFPPMPADPDIEAVKAEMQRKVEQALYEAEVDGLLRSAGRIDIAKRVVAALTATSPCACGYPTRHTNLPCSPDTTEAPE